MIDTRANWPSEQQVERAAKAMQNESGGFFSLESWRHLARVALTTAGVAPQEPSAVTDINGHSWMTWEESGKNGTYCRSCGGWAGKVGNRQCSSAPALRSSGVDEAALAEVIARVTDLWDDPLDEVHDIPQIARAMAEWLKEQRGESRGE